MIQNKIKINLKSNSYDVIIKKGLIKTFARYLSDLNIGKKILVVTQDRVPKNLLLKLKKSLKKNGFYFSCLILPSGEKFKNLSSLLEIIHFAVKYKFERNDSFIALGGGVVSDLTGFAASVYYRGVNFIAVPTTLLGMVDAAIGGKTAINLEEGKNLLGTFYQPKIVLIDPDCLKTLPKKEFLTGIGEIIKYALLEKSSGTLFSRQSFFTYLKKKKNKILQRNPEELINIISYSVSVKANIISKDEKELNIRAILNLGHTFGHAIEQVFHYKKYTHGEAVAIGLCFASKLSCKLHLLKPSSCRLILNLIKDYGLPDKLNGSLYADKILNAMSLDKKNKDGKIRFILPYKKIGRVKIISDVFVKEIKNLLLTDEQLL